MHGSKSAILAIFQIGPGWPCTVSGALKNPSKKAKLERPHFFKVRSGKITVWYIKYKSKGPSIKDVTNREESKDYLKNNCHWDKHATEFLKRLLWTTLPFKQMERTFSIWILLIYVIIFPELSPRSLSMCFCHWSSLICTSFARVAFCRHRWRCKYF